MPIAVVPALFHTRLACSRGCVLVFLGDLCTGAAGEEYLNLGTSSSLYCMPVDSFRLENAELCLDVVECLPRRKFKGAALTPGLIDTL